jgi:glutathione peroxidase
MGLTFSKPIMQLKSITPLFAAALLHSALVFTTPAAAQAAATAPAACPALLNHTVKRLQDDSPLNLCQYAGKVILVVNTASKCGFTGQFDPLEKLYKQHKAKGLVVLGFPSNDFAQELKSSKEIADFCVNTYGVEFPMVSKTVVSGKDAHPIYKQLAAATKGDAPSWNFHKYLIARDGKTVVSYNSLTSPDSGKVTQRVQALLAEK